MQLFELIAQNCFQEFKHFQVENTSNLVGTKIDCETNARKVNCESGNVLNRNSGSGGSQTKEFNVLAANETEFPRCGCDVRRINDSSCDPVYSLRIYDYSFDYVLCLLEFFLLRFTIVFLWKSHQSKRKYWMQVCMMHKTPG